MFKSILLSMSLFVFVFSCNKSSDATENNIQSKQEITSVKDNSNKEKKQTNVFTPFFAPDFELKTTTDEIIKLSDYKGKVVIIDFWGLWCPPCKKMIPVLAQFVNECSKEGVSLLGIHSVSNFPGNDKIDFFAGEVGVNYPMLIGTSENEKNYQITAFPTLYIIGKDGFVNHKFMGYHSLESIKEKVREELNKK